VDARCMHYVNTKCRKPRNKRRAREESGEDLHPVNISEHPRGDKGLILLQSSSFSVPCRCMPLRIPAHRIAVRHPWCFMARLCCFIPGRADRPARFAASEIVFRCCAYYPILAGRPNRQAEEERARLFPKHHPGEDKQSFPVSPPPLPSVHLPDRFGRTVSRRRCLPRATRERRRRRRRCCCRRGAGGGHEGGGGDGGGGREREGAAPGAAAMFLGERERERVGEGSVSGAQAGGGRGGDGGGGGGGGAGGRGAAVARRRRAPRRGSHPAVFQRGTRHSAPGTVATRQSHPTDLLSLTSLFDS